MTRREKRGSGKKILLLGTILCLSVSGCGQNPQKQERGKEQAKQERATEEKTDTLWNEKWQVEYTDDENGGFDISMQMKCFVIRPENPPDSIVEVKEIKNDSQYKEKVVKMLFGDEAYLYDTSHMAKAALIKELEERKESLAGCNKEIEELLKFRKSDERSREIFLENGLPFSYRKGLIESLKRARKMRKFLKEKIENIKMCLKDAPDALEPVLVGDGEYDCDSYLGYINGIAYRLQFNGQRTEKIVEWKDGSGLMAWEDEWEYDDSQTVTLAPLDSRDIAPEEFASADEIFYSGGHRETENRCSFTNADALKIAEDFLKKLGFDDIVETDVTDILWTDDPNSQAGILEGYRFFFQEGRNGVPFTSEGANPTPVNKISHPIGEDFAEVCVTEDGVVAFHLHAPMEVKNITPNVQLLDFKDIQDMLRTKMPEYIKEIIQYEEENPFEDFFANLGDEIQIRKIELCYCRLEDTEKKGEYTFVPAWKLDKFMVINAIDGSFIST